MLKAIQLRPSNYLITYYLTLDEVTWLLRQEKMNKIQIFLKKTCQFYQKTSKSLNVKFLKTKPLNEKTKQ